MTNLVHIEDRAPKSLCDSEVRRRISYIHHPDFDQPEIVHEILETLTDAAGSGHDRITGEDYRLPDRPLLSVDAERQLMLRMNLLKCLAARRLSGPAAERAESSERVVSHLLADANRLRNTILEANQRLVVSNAALFKACGIPLADLVSEANLAMMQAIDRFDVSRGYRLSTYATYAIRRHLSRYVQRDIKRRPLFPDSPTEPRIQDTPGEWLDDHPESLVRDILNDLPTREREIVRLRFGLGPDGKPRTLRHIGQRFGISKERVRQLIGRACEAAYERYRGRLGLT